jgi:hypothetical protein
MVLLIEIDKFAKDDIIGLVLLIEVIKLLGDLIDFLRELLLLSEFA